jgi:hypothetical protein
MKLFGALFGRKTAPPAPQVGPDLQFPAPKRVGATEQALEIIGALQEEGLTGFVAWGRILTRYPEYCLMFGFEPIAHTLLGEALAEFCVKQRPRVGHRQKITGYVIPQAGTPPWPQLPNVIPIGDIRRPSSVKERERARTGTSHAQA